MRRSWGSPPPLEGFSVKRLCRAFRLVLTVGQGGSEVSEPLLCFWVTYCNSHLLCNGLVSQKCRLRWSSGHRCP